MVEAAAPPLPDVSVDETSVDPSAEASDMPLEPPSRLPKPNRQSYENKKTALRKEIEVRQERNKEITRTLDQLRKTAEEKEAIIKKKQKEFYAVLDEKRAARRSSERIAETRKTLKEETWDMKKQNHSIDSPAKIEAQIIKLQNKHDHTSMSLAEVKKLVADIDRLKALRGTAATYAERINALKVKETEWKAASNELNELNEELNTMNTCLNELRDDLGKEKAKTQARISDLSAEKKNNGEINNVANAKLRELLENWLEDNDIYWEAEQRFRAWYEWDKQKREEAKSQEEAEMRAHDPGHLFDEEVGYCDQLTTYLSKFLAADAKAIAGGDAPIAEGSEILNEGYKGAPTAIAPGTLDGKVLMPMSENHSLNVDGKIDYSLSNGKKKVGKKHKKGTVRTPNQPAEQKQAEQKLVHSIDNVRAFAKLNIELPLTAFRVPATLEIIKARKQHFLAERAKGKMENSEVAHDTPKPIDTGDIVNGHTAPGTSKGGATAKVSAKSDSPPEAKAATRGKAGAKEVHISVDDQKFPTLDAARNAKVRKGWKVQSATCST